MRVAQIRVCSFAPSVRFFNDSEKYDVYGMETIPYA